MGRSIVADDPGCNCGTCKRSGNDDSDNNNEDNDNHGDNDADDEEGNGVMAI